MSTQYTGGVTWVSPCTNKDRKRQRDKERDSNRGSQRQKVRKSQGRETKKDSDRERGAPHLEMGWTQRVGIKSANQQVLAVSVRGGESKAGAGGLQDPELRGRQLPVPSLHDSPVEQF